MTRFIIFLLISNLFFVSSTFADLQVPRWVSLKGDANLRKGPSPDATIIYRYQTKGYPMEVLRDIDGYKYIKDHLDGVEGWMAKELFSGKRYAITTKSPFSYGYDSPKKNKILAKLAPKVHAKIDKCDSSWCKLIIDDENFKVSVWVEKDNLIGVYKHEIIN